MATDRPVPVSLKNSLDATKVDYVRLGSSGLRVSWRILGAMSFGDARMVPFVLGEEASLEMLKAAYDCGINTWDTANTYSNGLGEEIIGKAIKELGIPRQKVVIMTKCAYCVGEASEVIGAMYAQQQARSKDYVNQGGELVSS